MHTRLAMRPYPLLDAALPEPVEHILPPLSAFMKPFVKGLHGQRAAQHATTYVGGLLSELERKHAAAMASRFGLPRLAFQAFIDSEAWDDEPVRAVLRRQVKTHLGHGDGVVVLVPSRVPKTDRRPRSATHQRWGRLGNGEHDQVAMYLGYVSRKGHALVDTQLFVPEQWMQDTARPNAVFTTSRIYHKPQELALELLATNGVWLPHSWIVGADELGRPYRFRRCLAALGERYMLAMPPHTVIRDLETALPAYGGRGRWPQHPWHQVATWSQSLADETWQHIDECNGSHSPLVIEAVQRRVESKTLRRQHREEETLVVIRTRDCDLDKVVQVEYYLSNAPLETPLGEFVRVVKAAHGIAEYLQCSTRDVGLADYEGCSWIGWQHHQTLALLATWFLVRKSVS
jgi:SRSO17 transposase